MNTGTRLQKYLSEYENSYPDAWNSFEQIRSERDNELPDWPESTHLCLTSNDNYQCYIDTLKNAYEIVCKNKHFVEVMPPEQRLAECHRFATVISSLQYIFDNEDQICDDEFRNDFPAFPYDDIAIDNVRKLIETMKSKRPHESQYDIIPLE